MKKIYEYICKAEVCAAMSALAMLSVLVLLSAVARSLHNPIVWLVDVATFLFAWCVFLAGDIAIRKDRLFCIELITSRIPPKYQYYLKFINQSIIIVFLSSLIVYGLKLSYTTRLRTFQGMPDVSYSWITLSVPIGGLLMLVTTILKLREQAKAGYDDAAAKCCAKELL